MRIDALHPKSPHYVKASFLRGQFEGLMLLGMPKSAVVRLRNAQGYTDPGSENEGGRVRPPVLVSFSGERTFPRWGSPTGGVGVGAHGLAWLA